MTVTFSQVFLFLKNFDCDRGEIYDFMIHDHLDNLIQFRDIVPFTMFNTLPILVDEILNPTPVPGVAVLEQAGALVDVGEVAHWRLVHYSTPTFYILDVIQCWNFRTVYGG